MPVHAGERLQISGVNEIDASGEEKVREVATRLREVGVTLMFSGLKHQVMRVFVQSGLVEELGGGAFFSDKETALRTLGERYGARGGLPASSPA